MDAAKTGILNADNLYEGLKKIDGDITREEVESVLKKLDKDGNGEIDFDEFLYHMTQGPDAGEGRHKCLLSLVESRPSTPTNPHPLIAVHSVIYVCITCSDGRKFQICSVTNPI